MKLCLGMTVLDPARGVGVIKEIDPYHKRRFLVKFDKHPRLYSYSNKGVCRYSGAQLSEVSIVGKDYEKNDWIEFDLKNLPKGLDLFSPPNAQPNIEIGRYVTVHNKIVLTDVSEWPRLLTLFEDAQIKYYWRKKVVKLQRTHEEIMSNWFLLDIRVPEFQGKLWSRIASYNPEANKYMIPYTLWVGKDYFTDLKMSECPNE